MTGIMIEYLLGLYFLISAVSLPYGGKLSVDIFKLVAGVILIVAAVVGKSGV